MNSSGRVIALLSSVALLVTSTAAEAQKSYDGQIRDLQTPQGIRTQATAATAASACSPRGYSFDFFNGVLTTTGDANRVREEQMRAYGTTAPNGEPIKYEVFYNQTVGLQDFFETFSQRMQQQAQAVGVRLELFWEALNGGGSMSDRIITTASGYVQLLDSYQQYEQSAVIGSIGTLLNRSPTIADYADHRTRLDAQILEGRKIILYAHSQGNLFMNVAYDYAAPKIGAASIKAIHVAPASPTTRGEWTLADLDLVINGLRAVGSVPSITNSIPGYLLRPAGLNGKKDFLGHGLLEIYMNPAISTAARIQGHVQQALNSLTTPAVTGQSGFFTATLTWNGSGDVDLHTYEPNNAHVYYAASQGTTGYLDVDNTVANGPEHYYASCDTAKLQTGSYRIGVNNYRGGDGRTAVVQISSRDGVLATRSLVLGASRGSGGDNSPTILSTVVVTKDATTGEYKIAAN